MNLRNLICVSLVLCLSGWCYSTSAAAVHSWSASTTETFKSGILEGTAIDAEGHVRLAPPVETIWGPEQGIVWDVLPSGGTGAFVALSGPGRVLRVAPGAEQEVWYESSEEILITALAPGEAGGLYLGIAPQGQVLYLRGAGSTGGRLDTGASFIWSLARGPQETLWIGTGLPGKLLRSTAGAEVEVLFDAGDDPVRCVVPLPDGGAVFGTGGRGRVIRVTPEGRPFVLLDAEEQEIVALAPRADGVIYALAAAPKRPSRDGARAEAALPPGVERVRVTATPPPPEEGGEEAERAETPRRRARSPAQTFRSAGGGALYRIGVNGAARALWRTAEEMPFDLLALDNGSLLIATGEAGRIYVLDEDGHDSRLWAVASSHASALAAGPDGNVVIGGTNDARVVRMARGPRSSGAYSSPAVDAGHVADWGRLRWEADIPSGAQLQVRVRSGNTAQPDETWTDWQTVQGRPGIVGAETGAPPTRWLQVRVDLIARDGVGPALQRLEIFYRPHNRAPEVGDFDLEPPGTVWVPGPTQSSNRLGPLVADDPVARRAASSLAHQLRRNGAIRKGYEAGARTFHWQGRDPDEDRLRYSLDLRLEGDTDWFPLVADLTESYFSWDARSLPDGLYRARLRADDWPDNPDGDHLTAERISRAFLVDNTRPRVRDLEVRPSSRGHEVAFVASDPGGGVAAVEVAMDAGGWRPLDPLDGVADSEEERYELLVDPAAIGDAEPRTLRVRVTDAAGNLGGELWIIGGP